MCHFFARSILMLEVMMVFYVALYFVPEPRDAFDDCAHLRLGPGKNGECHFSRDYVEARSRFRRMAEEAGGFEMYNYTVYNKNGLELTTDIAILPGLTDRVLVHFSGVHGPEGFAGSAVQSASLAYRNFEGKDDVNDQPHPTMIYVHAVNPFGFFTNRRVNEDNIDLNRNFLSPKGFRDAAARDPNIAGYVSFDHLLNPTSKPFKGAMLNALYEMYTVISSIARFGLVAIKRAMVSGNYHKPEGLYYGGHELTASSDKLIKFLRNYLEDSSEKGATRVALIDVHTGLGPSGKDTLHVSAAEAEKAWEVFHDIDLKREPGESALLRPSAGMVEYPGNAAGAMSGYELMIGGTTDFFCGPDFRPWKHLVRGENKICVTQEFGTVAPASVGRGLIAENYAWHHDPDANAAAGMRVRDVFFVDKVSWKRSVVTRGVEVIQQAVDYLMDDDDDIHGGNRDGTDFNA